MDLPPLPWTFGSISGAPPSGPASGAPPPFSYTPQQHMPGALPQHLSRQSQSDALADNDPRRPSPGVSPSFPYMPRPSPGPLSQYISSPASTSEILPPNLRNYSFGPSAPSRNLLFPRNANLTAVELLTFLPNSIHSGSVIYRLCTNGAKPGTIHAIVNAQRESLVPWNQSKCRQALYDSMRRAGYKDWTMKLHATYHAPNASTWDSSSLDVPHFLTPAQVRNNDTSMQVAKQPELPAADIPFKLLATNVRRMPQGFDALDLTRMVQHCVDNPDEPWMYPGDWEALLGVVGGRVQVRKEHTDGECFERWKDLDAPQAGKEIPNELLEAEGREETKKRVHKAKETTAGDGPKRKKQRKEKAVTPREDSVALSMDGILMEGSRGQSRTVTPGSPAPSIGPESTHAALQPKKKRGRPFKTTRVKKEPNDEFVDVGRTSLAVEMAPKTRKDQRDTQPPTYHMPTYYVAPPHDDILPLRDGIAVPVSTDAALASAFDRDGQLGETDVYSAYAFGGPRTTPPYRQLYRIEQPDPDDSSGWAENLRWAFEQNTLFRYPLRPDVWNESPQHMEHIVKIRNEQLWMSEESLEM